MKVCNDFGPDWLRIFAWSCIGQENVECCKQAPFLSKQSLLFMDMTEKLLIVN